MCTPTTNETVRVQDARLVHGIVAARGVVPSDGDVVAGHFAVVTPFSFERRGGGGGSFGARGKEELASSGRVDASGAFGVDTSHDQRERDAAPQLVWGFAAGMDTRRGGDEAGGGHVGRRC